MDPRPHDPAPPPRPPESWAPLLRLKRLARRPLDRFLRIEASSGIVLLVAAAAALLWANSPWADGYRAFCELPLGVRLGGWAVERSLAWVVNDVLMVVFFFVVGMEIRRELDHGELSDGRRAALPVAAAVGGMAVPALLYLGIAGSPDTRSGWGVPMATDIAFALGVLSLLGRRVPAALRVLLLALAVIDDLGAIAVIAVFYSAGIGGSGLAVAGLGVLGILGLRAAGVRPPLAYVVPGAVVWLGTYLAGIHPTIAGVVIGLLTPVRAWLGGDGAAGFLHGRLDALGLGRPAVRAQDVQALTAAAREAVSPAESLIARLHPWVAYGVMPLFALVNAGVSLEGLALTGAQASVAWGVGAGLVVGKPLGVVLICALALRSGHVRLPGGLGPRHLLVLGLVAGIGFTMALFIAQLAFTGPAELAAAKLGVLAASGTAAALGLAAGRLLLPLPGGETPSGVAASADEAESATEL